MTFPPLPFNSQRNSRRGSCIFTGVLRVGVGHVGGGADGTRKYIHNMLNWPRYIRKHMDVFLL